MTQWDRRLTPARPDLAASHLQGKVDAARYAQGIEHTVIEGVAPLRRHPAADAMLETELLYGERFVVYEEREGWAWGQSAADGYVGYAPAAALAQPQGVPTHRVAAMRSFVFPAPDLKRPPLDALPLNASVRVVDEEGGYAAIAPNAYVVAQDLKPIGENAPDWVAVAERFLGVPYLWGGKTMLGCDCSGLVQAALWAAGINCPRDTDMQERALGRALEAGERLRRGDLVFWKGHVGILRDADTLLHANAFHMRTETEALAGAIARIAAASGPVTAIRRL